MSDPNIFSLNDHPRVESRPIAGRRVLVVDDVYKHPDLVRRFALGLDFDQQAGMYPGRMASIAAPATSLLDLVNGLIPDSGGRSLVDHPDYQGRLTFALLSQPGHDL